MIVTEQQNKLNDVLNQVAIELDIPPHKYDEAMDRFDAIKRHLEAGDYPCSTPPPDVYLQGSFRLGTVIRPVKTGNDCEFDIDIVCQVDRDKDGDDPENLKNEVGNEVKGYAKKNNMERPKNSCRCWALNYAPDGEGIGFHVDILPSLPDPAAASWIAAANEHSGTAHRLYTKTTIAITNRDESVTPNRHEWRSSNPMGFAGWFKDICAPGYAHVDNRRQKQLLFETYSEREGFRYDKAQDIPDALVRTPLQRAIQIMKRHRDVRFTGHRDEDHKPISMIITTLAAKLYEGRASQYQTTRAVLRFIVDTLAQHAALVENRELREEIGSMQLIRRVGDKWYIPNPVNPHNPNDPDEKGENFADRWHEDDHAWAKAFFRWVEWLKDDLDMLLTKTGEATDVERTLDEAFGHDIATRALGHLGIKLEDGQSGILLKAPSAAVSRFDVSHRDQPKWPVHITHQVAIDGRATRQGWRTLTSQNGFRRIDKRFELRFEAKTDVARPYEVHWQVVNTGHEAESTNGLRGQIFPDSNIRRESTLYTGFHWIECFIVKEGVLVARSGEFVVNVE